MPYAQPSGFFDPAMKTPRFGRGISEAVQLYMALKRQKEQDELAKYKVEKDAEAEALRNDYMGRYYRAQADYIDRDRPKAGEGGTTPAAVRQKIMDTYGITDQEFEAMPQEWRDNAFKEVLEAPAKKAKEEADAKKTDFTMQRNFLKDADSSLTLLKRQILSKKEGEEGYRGDMQEGIRNIDIAQQRVKRFISMIDRKQAPLTQESIDLIEDMLADASALIKGEWSFMKPEEWAAAGTTTAKPGAEVPVAPPPASALPPEVREYMKRHPKATVAEAMALYEAAKGIK